MAKALVLGGTAGYAALGAGPGRCQLPRGADDGADRGGRGDVAGRSPLTRLADSLDRFLLPLVLISAAVGVSFPGPGRRADAGDAILFTLAVLVFCTGASGSWAPSGRRAAAWLSCLRSARSACP